MIARRYNYGQLRRVDRASSFYIVRSFVRFDDAEDSGSTLYPISYQITRLIVMSRRHPAFSGFFG
jgi:hypothetical protein